MKALLVPFTAAVLAFAVTGCATLKPGAEAVKIVDPAELSKLDSCKEIGPVSEVSEHGQSELVKLLKNKTVDHGGNVVVSKLRTEKTMGFFKEAEITKGVVYRCDEKILASVHNSENF